MLYRGKIGGPLDINTRRPNPPSSPDRPNHHLMKVVTTPYCADDEHNNGAFSSLSPSCMLGLGIGAELLINL